MMQLSAKTSTGRGRKNCKNRKRLITQVRKLSPRHKIEFVPRWKSDLGLNGKIIRHRWHIASRSRDVHSFEMNIWVTGNKQNNIFRWCSKREGETNLTIRNGWFVFCRTRFSAIVCLTSSFWIITSFFRILMAKSFPVVFSRQRITLPNVPFPSTFKNSKFSRVWNQSR